VLRQKSKRRLVLLRAHLMDALRLNLSLHHEQVVRLLLLEGLLLGLLVLKDGLQLVELTLLSEAGREGVWVRRVRL
jgi:hypothetical protein